MYDDDDAKIKPDTTMYSIIDKNIITKHLTLIHWNLNGVLVAGRMEQLITYNDEINADIICLSETKLDESIPNSMIKLDGFNIIRRDRNKWGGGIIIYIKDNLSYKQIPDLESTIIEHCSVDIFVNKI